MHEGGDARLDDPQWAARSWNGPQAYSDSKLLDVVLAFAVARRWPSVLSNALEPGWVPTKMGGPGAPDDLSLAPVTQTWLAVSDDPAARVTGQHFYHQQRRRVPPATLQKDLQDELLASARPRKRPVPRESRTGGSSRPKAARRVRFRVKSRHDTLKSPCPLYPGKQTSVSATGMSPLCHSAARKLLGYLVGNREQRRALR